MKSKAQMTEAEILNTVVYKLKTKINNTRRTMRHTPISSRPINLSIAAAYCSPGMSGNDITEILAINEMVAKQGVDLDLQKYMPIIVGGIVVMGLIYFIAHFILHVF